MNNPFESQLRSNLFEVGDEIHRNKVAHGWKVTTKDDWKEQHEIPAVLMLITTEVAEAMEAFRNNDTENFAEELADVVIRTIGLSHGMGIDLASEIVKKMEKNKNRPIKHGGKRL